MWKTIFANSSWVPQREFRNVPRHYLLSLTSFLLLSPFPGMSSTTLLPFFLVIDLGPFPLSDHLGERRKGSTKKRESKWASSERWRPRARRCQKDKGWKNHPLFFSFLCLLGGKWEVLGGSPVGVRKSRKTALSVFRRTRRKNGCWAECISGRHERNMKVVWSFSPCCLWVKELNGTHPKQ